MSLISRLLIGLLVAVLVLLAGCEVQKEGVKTVQVQLSLDHQDAAGRSLSRTGSRNENLTQGVRTELVLALSAAIGATKNYRALDPQDSGLSNLLDSTVSLNLPLNTSLRLAVFRFRGIYSTAQLKAQLRDFDSYGFSAPFTLSASQSDLTVEITILPNGTPAVQVGRLNGVVSESGSQATFTVALATAPKEDVQIPLTVSDTSEGSVTPTPLTFTPVNWFTTQTVTVSGRDDFVDDDNVTWTVQLGNLTSLDMDYNDLNPADIYVTTTDNDTAGITVSVPDNTSSESGQSASLTVRLDSQPTDNVTIPVISTNTSEGIVSPAKLSFTATNWNTPQAVTITGKDDFVDDEEVSYKVKFGPVSSADTKYTSRAVQDVSLVNTDNDTAGITVSVPDSTSSESGQTANLTVRLNSRPLDNVTVSVASSDNTSGKVNTPSLTFTPASWNTAQTVTVTGQPNNSSSGSTYQVNFGAAVSMDSKYQGEQSARVSLTNVDDLAPTVSSVTPADNSTNIALASSLSATFSEALKTNSVYTNSNTTACANASSTVLLSTDNFTTCLGLGTPAFSDNQSFSIVPTSPGLAYDKTYQLRIKGGTGGVSDTAGNPLASSHTVSFSTPVRPRLTATVPDNNSTAVSRYSALSLTFSKDMNTQTFAGISSSPQLQGTSAYTSSTYTYTFTPSGPLSDNTTYTFTLPDNITDTSGIPLAATTLSFKTTDLGSGLVAYYTLDNNTFNHAANIDNGTVSGATLTSGRTGDNNTAYSFDGTNDKITVAYNSTLNFSASSSATFSVWVYPQSFVSLNGIFSKYQTSGANGYYLRISDSNGTVRFGENPAIEAPNLLTLNTWQHLSVTVSGGQAVLYLNGVAVKSGTVSWSTTSGYFSIGCDYCSSNDPQRFFQGKLDDLRIYNRALSANEVFDLYFEPTRSLAAYYPLAGNGNDLSGNSYHGILGSENSEPSVTTGHSGLNAQAYFFDGTDDYIALNKYVSPNSISSTTVCVWAKSDNQSKDKYLISFDQSESWRLALNDDQGGNNVGWDTTQYGGTTNNLNTSLSYEDGQWHHICGWYEAGKAPDKKIYVDGTLVQSTTAHGGSNLGTSYRTKHYGYLGWGSESGSFNDQTTSTHSDDFMQGSIDDVRIYDRALSDNEISALYSVADKHPPLPGNSGTLATSNVSSSELTLTWSTATDDFTGNASLQYKVVRADSDRIRIPETAELNGTLVQDWTVNFDNVSVSGLSASTSYHFTVLVRDNASNVASYQTTSQTTSAAASSADAASATINWGTNTNYQDVVVYTVDKEADTLGTINDYSSFCTSKDKRYISAGYPASGNSYSSSNTSSAIFLAAKNYFENTVQPSISGVTYDNLLVLHGNSAGCWAHNAENGSMHAFGGSTGAGYAFCRSGNSASKRFHMYICK